MNGNKLNGSKQISADDICRQRGCLRKQGHRVFYGRTYPKIVEFEVSTIHSAYGKFSAFQAAHFDSIPMNPRLNHGRPGRLYVTSHARPVR